MNPERKQKARLYLQRGDKFPEKLYAVVEDGRILRWDSNGVRISLGFPTQQNASNSLIEENPGPKNYEALVMDLYPGFVQIPQFTNLRRLFREYSFGWHVSSRGVFSFSHPYFRRGRQDLLANIKTRRKTIPFYKCGFGQRVSRRSLKLKRDPDEFDYSEELPPDFHAALNKNNNSLEEGKVTNVGHCEKQRETRNRRSKINNEAVSKLDSKHGKFEQSEMESSRQRLMKKLQLRDILSSYIKNEFDNEQDIQLLSMYLFCWSGIFNGANDTTDQILTETLSSPFDSSTQAEYIEWLSGNSGYLRPVSNSGGNIIREYCPL
ncbi:XP_009051111.1hypothetical protein LOTGIDRAFT_159233 [Octopus vulgaris]|uniref:HSF-type DNA-binding domain-containing protein n=1 Tax=Octopus vulgaris TaxID=6645 RepID=A0AA36AMG3_OCTVU|nr:XP_009051111.1hypothetical protein LOTGIDRAFT_159233 [Octopus vulgaris]